MASWSDAARAVRFAWRASRVVRDPWDDVQDVLAALWWTAGLLAAALVLGLGALVSAAVAFALEPDPRWLVPLAGGLALAALASLAGVARLLAVVVPRRVGRLVETLRAWPDRARAEIEEVARLARDAGYVGP